MTDQFTEFHDELRAVAAEVLAKDRTVDWPVLADAGWVGLEVADEFGGAGASFGEVAVICSEMGRAATASSYLGGAVLGVGALNAVQPDAARDDLLTAVAAGAERTALVLGPFTFTGGRLTGRAEFVPDASGADRLLVLATDSDGTPVLTATAAATVTAQPVLDETRRLAVVCAEDSGVEAVWRFAGDPRAAARRLADRAAVAVAIDSLGLAEAMLSATVSYAKVRHQFGRPIGSFQAVKHACADMQVQITVARQLVGRAVAALCDPDSDDTAAAAAMAKSFVCSAAVEVVGKAMQLHGGIGYTWESGVHVYLKRATLNRALYGSPAAHRSQLVSRYR
ncbi:acyl-CoA dehydrogenase family protein [Mycolicibacterium thermoresistibile]|jgi:alkylation response protein AidB-like acyl-CoA dehydrogenase|uniref:Acyl-CoA dehydrogenase n=2 Tax=Mycolicibacterium thermoresistibile TaxID=1797 RepID=G7CJI7_MYCT3|nr:acyl-CoA dehydrogenase family protein [Mycolicibacterium thermoresistibile]EHI11507.1 acyl-CoA dehydrogenase [Mycolicibacterium thermoresistibile ATCC 19527]MCV7189065.1 acyl-CoA/acyl-ACP dehydrogenase [Mycolicibacterium thermoresistibile]GAT14747.1 acyl-CoA dehydrogenase [Mycolicibacterium thermoresistibile]SNW19973.1 acyl-CoA dehydrogenase [Mycolicibacterium thermoresistibile]